MSQKLKFITPTSFEFVYARFKTLFNSLKSVQLFVIARAKLARL